MKKLPYQALYGRQNHTVSSSCRLPQMVLSKRHEQNPVPPAELVAKSRALQEQLERKVPAGLPAVLDRIVAAILLLLLAPLMLVIALIIRLDSPGPAIFRQIRIGQDRRWGKDRRRAGAMGQVHGVERRQGERRKHALLGRPFVFYKFRTMRHDARAVYPDLFDFEHREADLCTLYLAMPDDPRVTRFGHFLRRTSLDELPNLFNILKGDMALVGPRPELPDVAKYYQEWQQLKFKVKPGLTGKAQVSGRGFLSFQETIVHDVEYVLQRSWWMDLRLILQTIGAVVRGFGAF